MSAGDIHAHLSFTALGLHENTPQLLGINVQHVSRGDFHIVKEPASCLQGQMAQLSILETRMMFTRHGDAVDMQNLACSLIEHNRSAIEGDRRCLPDGLDGASHDGSSPEKQV
jgi:hypothetical protein